MDVTSLTSLYNSILSDVQPQEKLQQNIELLNIDKVNNSLTNNVYNLFNQFLLILNLMTT